MSKLLDTNIVVSDGSLQGAYNDRTDAEDQVESILEDDMKYVTEEYGLDEDSDDYVEEAAYMAGYEGSNPYSDSITIDMDDLDKTYTTSEGDEFSGGEIVDMYQSCGYNAELDSYDDDDE